MTEKLTPEARKALLAALSSRQGERVLGAAAVLDELHLLGLVGPQDGLTRTGSIVRDRLFTAMLDEAF